MRACVQVDCDVKSAAAALYAATASSSSAADSLPTISLLPFLGPAASSATKAPSGGAAARTLYTEYGRRSSFSFEPCTTAASGGSGSSYAAGGGSLSACAATAADKEDGDLSAYTTVTDVTPCSSDAGSAPCVRCTAAGLTLGVCLPGRYLLQYSVSDADGNTATAALAVIVEQLAASSFEFTVKVGTGK